MQRWLAGRTRNATASILIGLAMIAAGVFWIVDEVGIHRYLAAVFTLLAAVNVAIGVAGIRERRSANPS